MRLQYTYIWIQKKQKSGYFFIVNHFVDCLSLCESNKNESYVNKKDNNAFIKVCEDVMNNSDIKFFQRRI